MIYFLGLPPKKKLKRHFQNAHEKARRFVCRYEGCTKNYNDDDSRSNHEKATHGMRYREALEKRICAAGAENTNIFN